MGGGGAQRSLLALLTLELAETGTLVPSAAAASGHSHLEAPLSLSSLAF